MLSCVLCYSERSLFISRLYFPFLFPFRVPIDGEAFAAFSPREGRDGTSFENEVGIDSDLHSDSSLNVSNSYLLPIPIPSIISAELQRFYLERKDMIIHPKFSGLS